MPTEDVPANSGSRFCLIIRSRDYPQRLVLEKLIAAGLSPVEVVPESWRGLHASIRPLVTIMFLDTSDTQSLGVLVELSEHLQDGQLLAVVPNAEEIPFVLAAGTDVVLTDDLLDSALEAKLAAMLKMLQQDPKRSLRSTVIAPGVSIDLGARRLSGPLGTVGLSPFEMSVFNQLAEHQGRVVPATTLVSTARGQDIDEPNASRTAKTYIRRMRKKLELVGGSADAIATVRSAGYMLESDR